MPSTSLCRHCPRSSATTPTSRLALHAAVSSPNWREQLEALNDHMTPRCSGLDPGLFKGEYLRTMAVLCTKRASTPRA